MSERKRKQKQKVVHREVRVKEDPKWERYAKQLAARYAVCEHLLSVLHLELQRVYKGVQGNEH
jgi:hypothetical protein